MAGEVIYETKVALHFLNLWQLLGFGRRVQVTSNEVRVEKRKAIPISSISLSELKFGVTRLAHVRLEYLGGDGTTNVIRFFPSGLQWGYREPEFASRLYTAIATARQAYQQGLGGTQKRQYKTQSDSGDPPLSLLKLTGVIAGGTFFGFVAGLGIGGAWREAFELSAVIPMAIVMLVVGGTTYFVLSSYWENWRNNPARASVLTASLFAGLLVGGLLTWLLMEGCAPPEKTLTCPLAHG